jgi:hydrogenase-4 component F
VGLTFALFGTILFYYAANSHGLRSLNWTDMLAAAPMLDPRILKVAFLFIIAGYGTKAGFAPMHTWLPDAHSQAPAPISAMLSGVLIKTSIFAILRFAVILNKSAAAGFTGHLFIVFGAVSLVVAAGFVLVQKDIKRLLAYSSIEHVGIIAMGFGFGGPLGSLGALFHIFNHAVTKSAMFFSAGSIVKKFGTNNMRKISGAVRALPFAGTFAAVIAFALAGMPPFSVFTSEIMILIAGFTRGSYTAVAVILAALVVAFASLVYYISKAVFGKLPENIVPGKESRGVKASLVFLAVIMIVFGVAMPPFFVNILESAAAVLR